MKDVYLHLRGGYTEGCLLSNHKHNLHEIKNVQIYENEEGITWKQNIFLTKKKVEQW